METNRTIILSSLFGLHARRFIADEPDLPIEMLPDIFRYLEEKGLSYLNIDETGRRMRGDALRTLYAYDKKQLQGFLDRNKETLIAAEWPTEADKFVLYLSFVSAPANSEIFDLIFECYNDRDRNNPWLSMNAQRTKPDAIDQQRQGAEFSKKAFFKVYPDFKIA